MPVYDYKCSGCGKTYDVYHKAKEIVEDVVCPGCGSTEHKKLFSPATVAISGPSAASSTPASSCEMGGECCGGSCHLN